MEYEFAVRKHPRSTSESFLRLNGEELYNMLRWYEASSWPTMYLVDDGLYRELNKEQLQGLVDVYANYMLLRNKLFQKARDVKRRVNGNGVVSRLHDARQEEQALIPRNNEFLIELRNKIDVLIRHIETAHNKGNHGASRTFTD